MILDTLQSLNEGDRLNLADIAWFMRGINYGKEKSEQPFDPDHFRTIEKVISAIRNHEIDSKQKERC